MCRFFDHSHHFSRAHVHGDFEKNCTCLSRQNANLRGSLPPKNQKFRPRGKFFQTISKLCTVSDFSILGRKRDFFDRLGLMWSGDVTLGSQKSRFLRKVPKLQDRVIPPLMGLAGRSARFWKGLGAQNRNLFGFGSKSPFPAELHLGECGQFF